MIINKVKEFRELAKLTQEDLALAVKVSRQTIISLEKGSYNPSLELALKLSKELNTTIEMLFSLQED